MGNHSRWDRYLGMTAAMTQVPVPVTTSKVMVVAKCSQGSPIRRAFFVYILNYIWYFAQYALSLLPELVK